MDRYEYCFECNKDVKPDIKTEKNNYTFRDKEFTVVEEVHYCPKCRSQLLNDTMDNSLYKIYDGYLSLFNLSFDKIKKIRTDLNLSQDSFADILNWSKKSIVRYENAQSVPQGEYLNMYVLLNDNPYYIVKLIEKKKEEMGKDKYYKLLRLLPFYDQYKTTNAILYILNNNSMYETNLQKNLFAIDFASYKENNYPITNLKYIHMNYGPVVDSRKDIYNFLIRNNYIEMENIDYSYGTKFKANITCDENIFSEGELNILKTVKNKLKKYDAKSLSDWSHKFKGWKETNNGQAINYKYAKYFDIENI